MMRLVSVVACLACACGGGAPRAAEHAKPPAPPSAPPIEALCPPVAHTLEAVADATVRGCFRQAGEALAALPKGPAWSLAAVELQQAALTMQSIGEGATRGTADLADPIVAFDPEPHLIDVVKAIAHDQLPRTVADDGRLLKDVLAILPTVTCPPVGRKPEAKDVDRFEAAWKKLADALGGMLLGPKDRPRMVLGVASLMLAKCDVKEAIGLREQAGDMLRRAGAFDEALAVDFETFEKSSFFGRAAESAELAADDRVPFLAFEIERREAGELKKASPAQILDKTLENNPKAARTPAVTARIAMLRAAVAYSYDGDYTTARKQARIALDQAIAAKRPDLADAARMIGAVAAQMQDDIADAARLFRDAFASARGRAAYGVSHELAEMVRTLVDVERERGRAQGDALAEQLTGVLDGLPAFDVYMLGRSLAESLETSGRLEDALVLIEKATPLVKAAPASPGRDEFVAQLAHVRRKLGALLDPHDAVDDLPESMRTGPLYELVRAFADGDAAAVRAGLRRTSAGAVFAVSADHACALVADRLVAEARDMIAHHAEVEKMRTREEGQMFGLIADLGYGLALCGATLNRPDLVKLAADAYALDPIERQRDPRRADLREAQMRGTAFEASKQYVQAAAMYLAIARDRAFTTDARAVVAAAQRTEVWFTRAAIALLRGGMPEQAIGVLEESRGRAFRVVSASVTRGAAGGRLATLAQRESELAALEARGRALTVIQQRTGNDLSARHAELEKRVAVVRAARDAAARELTGTQPDAMRTAGFLAVPTADELRARLRPDEALVYYVISADESWAIVLDTAGAKAIQLPALAKDGVPELYLAINRAKKSIGDLLERGRGLVRVHHDAPGAGASTDDLAELYRMLVAPLEGALPKGRRAIVVPDAAIGSLPFAALGPKDAPWIARNPLRVLIGGFMLPPKPVAARSGGGVLVAGGAVYEEASAAGGRGGAAISSIGASWSALPGTEREAATVAALYKTTPLVGRALTEEALRERMPTARVVHLATHGYADTSQPAYSAIVASVPAPGSQDDGLLHAYEIERLSLDADLVVLSACETGRGQARGPEGALALDRAFLVAGARAVVSSLWTVPDEATAALMTAMHRRLAAGDPADLALAAAMNQLRADPKTASPMAWAAFRVVGAGLR